MYALNTDSFRDKRLLLFIKALKINAHLSLKSQKNHYNSHAAANSTYVCDTLHDPTLFRPLHLFTFFFSLRVSNILPHSMKKFDVTRQLVRGDLIFSENYCTINLKWSKTLQDWQQSHTISKPHLGSSPLCPMQALQ